MDKHSLAAPRIEEPGSRATSRPPPLGGASTQLQSTLAVLGSVVAVVAFQLWTLCSDGLRWLLGQPQNDYYNLLVHGFLRGQLYLDTPVAPSLLACANPYDPAARPSTGVLFDAVLHGGHWYLYHGPVPAILTMLPFRLVTGLDLPIAASVGLFCIVGGAASAWLVEHLVRQLRPQTGPVERALLVASVSLGSMTVLLLRRHSFYDLAIAGGYCLSMLAVAARARASEQAQGEVEHVRWMALAGLCWGLAIGSRPNLLVGCLAVVLAGSVRLRTLDQGTRASRRAWGALLGPLLLVGLALAWYNQARFDSPFELGTRYQVNNHTGSAKVHYHPRYLASNLHACFLACPQLQPRFPFLFGARHVQPPELHSGFEDEAYGVLLIMPLLGLACALPHLTKRSSTRVPLTHDILRLAVINTLLTGMLSGSSCRYYVDFAPWWALCAAASWLYLRRLLDLSPHARGATLLPRLGLCCTLWSMICIFLYSAGLYRHLETSNPSLYQALARVTEGPLESLAAWWAPREGPQRLTVHLGNPPPGTRILLLKSGTDDARDRLELEVLESSRMRFVFGHHGAPDVLSPSLPHAPGRSHEVSISAGFLYPSETSPGWLRRGRKAMLEHTRRLLVQVDGQVVLDRYQRFHARPLLAADLTPATIGQGAQITALKGFDDVDRAWARRINPSPTFGLPPAGRHLYGTIRFGQGAPGQSEPLLVLGRSGAADVLLARWVDPTHVLLGLEHWGSPCRLGAPLRIDARRSMRFAVNMTPIPTSNECSVEVHLDGQVVATFRSRLYPWEAEDCYLGENAVGSTIVLPRFGGQIAISSDDALAGQSP